MAQCIDLPARVAFAAGASGTFSALTAQRMPLRAAGGIVR